MQSQQHKPIDPANGKKRLPDANAKPRPDPPSSTGEAAADVPAWGFTALPSLETIARGPVCESGVCYVPGAGPDAPKPKP